MVSPHRTTSTITIFIIHTIVNHASRLKESLTTYIWERIFVYKIFNQKKINYSTDPNANLRWITGKTQAYRGVLRVSLLEYLMTFVLTRKKNETLKFDKHFRNRSFVGRDNKAFSTIWVCVFKGCKAINFLCANLIPTKEKTILFRCVTMECEHIVFFCVTCYRNDGCGYCDWWYIIGTSRDVDN